MESSENVPWTEVYRRLMEEAPYIPGDAGDTLDGSQIKWANPKLIEQGQIFVKKNLFSINLAHSAALILGFSLKNMTTVLLRTGNFTGVINSMDRYIDTEDHLKSWYETDIFHSSGDGYKAMQIVRKMHSAALKKCLASTSHYYMPDESNIEDVEAKLKFAEAIKNDLECVDTSEAPTHLFNTYNPKVLMTQHDMAMTQYGFFALIYMFPASFGVYDAKELDGFVHLWAVLGKLVGVQDRYNLALYPNRELYAKIHDQIGVASFKDIDLTSADLQFSFAEALGRMMHHGLSAPALFYFSCNSKTSIPQFKGNHLYKLLSWRDLFFIQVIGFILFMMCNASWFNRWINDGFRIFAPYNREKVLSARKIRRKSVYKD